MSGWQEIGDRVFRRRYREWDLNVGVVVGADAVLVVDTRGSHREADELRGHLRELGRGPVRWAVNTHAHFDHCFGNARFRPPEEDAELWGHEAVPAYLAANGERTRRRLAEDLPALAEALAEVVVTPPDHLVGDAGTIDLGDRGVALRHLGRGHTDTDVVLVVDDAGVVFAGDVVEESAPPAYGDDCFPLDWPATADRLLGLVGDATVVVPGHGDVGDRPFTTAQRDGVAAVARLLRELHAAGVPVDAALDEAGDRWPWPARAMGHAVTRGYAQLDGTLR